MKRRAFLSLIGLAPVAAVVSPDKAEATSDFAQFVPFYGETTPMHFYANEAYVREGFRFSGLLMHQDDESQNGMYIDGERVRG